MGVRVTGERLCLPGLSALSCQCEVETCYQCSRSDCVLSDSLGVRKPSMSTVPYPNDIIGAVFVVWHIMLSSLVNPIAQLAYHHQIIDVPHCWYWGHGLTLCALLNWLLCETLHHTGDPPPTTWCLNNTSLCFIINKFAPKLCSLSVLTIVQL